MNVCCILLFIIVFPGDITLASNENSFGIMSCILSFIFDRPIIHVCKAVRYIDQPDNILSVDTLRFRKLMAD